MTFTSKFIDGSDATEYQKAIAPLISEVADTVSEAEELPLEWQALWAAMEKQPYPWVKTTERMYHEMLEVLPPISMGGGGFLVGEAQTHNNNGEPVYAGFVKIGNYYQARYMTLREFTEWRRLRL